MCLFPGMIACADARRSYMGNADDAASTALSYLPQEVIAEM